MPVCQIEEKNKGGVYPRSCPTCGFGVCSQGYNKTTGKKFLPDEKPADTFLPRDQHWRKVVAVAVQDKRTKLCFTLPAPNRHVDVLSAMRMGQIDGDSPDFEQGFILETGEFVDRWNGARHAKHSRQIEKLRWPPDLYSEDLWPAKK